MTLTPDQQRRYAYRFAIIIGCVAVALHAVLTALYFRLGQSATWSIWSMFASAGMLFAISTLNAFADLRIARLHERLASAKAHREFGDEFVRKFKASSFGGFAMVKDDDEDTPKRRH